MAKHMRVTMADGSRWDVPVSAIARSRAKHYADEFGDDVGRSLAEDTLPLFDSDPGEIVEWAVSNMNWSDVEGVAFKALDPPPGSPRFEWSWLNGDKELVDR